MNIWQGLETMRRVLGARDQRGAIGWLTLGIIIGAILVVVLLVKLLIPGD